MHKELFDKTFEGIFLRIIAHVAEYGIFVASVIVNLLDILIGASFISYLATSGFIVGQVDCSVSL